MKTTFEEFYSCEYSALLKYIRYKFPNLLDHEEVLQDAFVVFYEKYYEKWDPSICELKTYFTNHLIKKCLYTLKRTKIKNIVSLEDALYEDITIGDSIAAEPETDKELIDLPILNKIAYELTGLKSEMWRLMILWVDGMSYEEIALKENMNISTLKSRLKAIRTHFCKEYNKITGGKLEFKKARTPRKNKEKQFYLKYKMKKQMNSL